MNTVYKAPKGKVYDWAKPHIAKIKEADGSIIEIVEHLYVNMISVSSQDDIKNYILVDEVK